MVLEKQLFLFLNIVHNSMKQLMSDSFRKGGFKLSPEQFLVMDTLWDEGVLTQQQIADITMRDKNSIVKESQTREEGFQSGRQEAEPYQGNSLFDEDPR